MKNGTQIIIQEQGSYALSVNSPLVDAKKIRCGQKAMNPYAENVGDFKRG
jgi:hypothetical protein